MNRNLLLQLAVLAFGTVTSFAGVFTVTNVNDSGSGSLRQAILDANANPGADTINFNIPSPGVQTITPTTVLPDITNTVAINGYSQPGSSANTLANGNNAVILIRLDEFKMAGASPAGLNFTGAGAGGSSVRGLCIVRCYRGIQINEAANVTIAGNWIGMDLDGIARGMISFEGIYVASFFNPANNIVIGGTTPADRNVISGNWKGIYFNGAKVANCFVQGNFIGTDPTGTLPRGNMFCGVQSLSATNLTIGGPSAAARNLICGATSAGGAGVAIQNGGGCVIQGNHIGTDVTGQYDLGNISDGINIFTSQNNRITDNQIVNNRANGINLASSTGTVVENNLIGTDASGTRPLGNALAGITISGSTNRIGGLSAGQANTIFYNAGAGAEITTSVPVPVRNEISGNAIYDNGGLGIDLSPTGINTNDVLDTDSGANGMQNFPVLTNAVLAYSALTVQGSLNSQAGMNYRLEFFATPTWDATNIPEGKVFLGATNVTTDGSGNAGFTAVINATPDTNYVITATATDPSGNTSEFSAGIGITDAGVASPSLAVSSSVSSDGGGVVTTTTVSWPGAATFFTLEKTPSLSLPVVWTPVTSGIVDNGGTKAYSVTNGGVSTNEFYRLKKL